MQMRRVKLLLWSAGIGLYVFGAFALVWGFLGSSDTRGQRGDGGRRPSVSREDGPRRPPGSQPKQFDLVSNKRLRPPLGEPVPVASLESDSDSHGDASRIQLVGTILEPSRSFAVFEIPPKSIQLKGVGEFLGDTGAEVVQIERERVVLRQQGRLMTLALHKATKPSAAATVPEPLELGGESTEREGTPPLPMNQHAEPPKVGEN